MFPRAAAGQPNATGEPGRGRGFSLGRWQSRVRGLGEAFGELPVVCLAEEIETAGAGQIRALLTVAGNPVVSLPTPAGCAGALESLEFMVSIDCYLNETTSLADVVLPVPSPLERGHYDLAFYQLSLRNIANFTPPSLPLSVMASQAGVAHHAAPARQWSAGRGPNADVDAIDDLVALETARRETVTEGSPAESAWSPRRSVLPTLGERRGPERIVDLMLRCGPYGAGLRRGTGPRGRRQRRSRPPRGPVAGSARGQPARDRPRSDASPRPGGAADRRRDDRRRSRGDRRRPRPARPTRSTPPPRAGRWS